MVSQQLVDTLPQGFGLVILAAFCHVIVLIYQSIMVVRARKRYGVPYPNLYAVKGISRLATQVSGSPAQESLVSASSSLSEADCNAFNCYQRAHQNTLEGTAPYFTFLLLGGLGFPLAAAILGFVFVLSRIVYAHGYYTGNPNNRHYGSFGSLCVFGLLGLAVTVAIQLLMATPTASPTPVAAAA